MIYKTRHQMNASTRQLKIYGNDLTMCARGRRTLCCHSCSRMNVEQLSLVYSAWPLLAGISATLSVQKKLLQVLGERNTIK